MYIVPGGWKFVTEGSDKDRIRGDSDMYLDERNMKKGNILDFLEKSEERFGHKTAVEDEKLSLTYHELAAMARRIGSAVSRRVEPGTPVPVLMEKSPLTLAVMFGIVYAGCFYVPVNPENPPERQKKIFETLDARLVITDGDADQVVRLAGAPGDRRAAGRTETAAAEKLLGEETDMTRLEQIRMESSESDTLYALFTSGSTGVPKAVMVSHGAVIRFIGHFTGTFGITEKDIIGNQAPFDFDVSVKDIYSCIMTGGTIVLIPKEYFSTPPRLLDYLCKKKVTTLIWAVSALTLLSALKGLDYRVPGSVNKVLFSGEAMPPKQLRIWQDALPDAVFVNLYGPTEITCNCTYYKVERKFGDEEKIPVGRAFPGRTVFLKDEEEGVIAVPGKTGEICVAGESLSDGYYKDRERTGQRFPMYPVDGKHMERIYMTGDLGYYDESGELIFAGRKDFQIKHMGHRIELEEIESALNASEGITKSCCIFDREKNRILGFYMGEAEPAQVRRTMKKKLPPYMIPAKLRQMTVMPLNKNGKTDRAYFMKLAKENRQRPGKEVQKI